MSRFYEEIIGGISWMRPPPGNRHERICHRLHDAVAAGMNGKNNIRLLRARSVVQLSAGTMLRPDLALVSIGNNRLRIAAEVISSQDHKTDTVMKKALYEDLNFPRLWMVDPRYDNVEIYVQSEYGLRLKEILGCRDHLTDPEFVPGMSLSLEELFGE